jgi:cyclopropane-fatty-acyl-phospholipid synthase
MSPRQTLAWRAAATALLRQIRDGSLVIVDETAQRRHTFGHGAPAAHIELHDPAFWRALMHGSRGLAQSYTAGLWDTPDLVAVIRLAARNAVVIDRVRRATAPLWTPGQRLRATLRPNDRRRNRRDIAAHYDLGNEMFGRMLDPTMSYSCALFERPGMSLEQASVAKLERVCEQLDLRASDEVIEIGTGWGAFALHAASTRGCRVTTTTISAAQHAYTVARVRQAGLEHLVTVLLRDYRDLEGRYDKLVSIEMIEAVGWEQIGTFFSRCSRLLRPDGAMLLQAITIDDRAYQVEKASRSFIKEYIFPGGCLPSLEVLQRNIARRTDLQTAGLHDLTASYVTTLQGWRERFLSHHAELEALGYDRSFRRLWTLYLAYCEAGFAERRICDVQLLLVKPRWRPPSAGATAQGSSADADRQRHGEAGVPPTPSEAVGCVA